MYSSTLGKTIGLVPRSNETSQPANWDRTCSSSPHFGGGEHPSGGGGEYEEDLVLSTTAEWLTKWHVGKLSLGDALHAGLMELQAPLHLERMLAGMGGRGVMEAPAEHP